MRVAWLVVGLLVTSCKTHHGIDITYEPDLEAAVAVKAREVADDLRRELAGAQLAGTITAAEARLTVVADEPARTALARYVHTTYPDSVATRDCDSAQQGALCLRVTRGYADRVAQACPDQAAEVLRERFDMLGDKAMIATHDRHVVVTLPADTDDELVQAEASLGLVTGTLELKLVDDSAPFMSALVRHATDPDAIAAEIAASTGPELFLSASDRDERLSVEDARRHHCPRPAQDGKVTCNVTGRDVITRYLARLAAADAAFAVPPGREIVFALGEGAWRTYLVDAQVQLAGSAIARASLSYDLDGDRPAVQLEFTLEGARQFDAVMARAAGKRLAILLDHTVKFVFGPTASAPIAGGKAKLAVSGPTQQRRERDAAELVAVLQLGAACPLRQVSVAKY